MLINTPITKLFCLIDTQIMNINYMLSHLMNTILKILKLLMAIFKLIGELTHLNPVATVFLCIQWTVQGHLVLLRLVLFRYLSSNGDREVAASCGFKRTELFHELEKELALETELVG